MQLASSCTFIFVFSGEEYKSLIEKREEARKMFHAKMVETSKVRTSFMM